jgi:hypothetical protein
VFPSSQCHWAVIELCVYGLLIEGVAEVVSGVRESALRTSKSQAGNSTLNYIEFADFFNVCRSCGGGALLISLYAMKETHGQCPARKVKGRRLNIMRERDFDLSGCCL